MIVARDMQTFLGQDDKRTFCLMADYHDDTPHRRGVGIGMDDNPQNSLKTALYQAEQQAGMAADKVWLGLGMAQSVVHRAVFHKDNDGDNGGDNAGDNGASNAQHNQSQADAPPSYREEKLLGLAAHALHGYQPLHAFPVMDGVHAGGGDTNRMLCRVVSAPRTTIETWRERLAQCDLRLEGACVMAYRAADKMLSEREKQQGSVFVYSVMGETAYVVYQQGRVTHSGWVRPTISHAVRDVMGAFDLNESQAWRTMTLYGLRLRPLQAGSWLSLFYNVLSSRLEEILSLVAGQVRSVEQQGGRGLNWVLAGNVTAILGLRAFAVRQLNRPLRLITDNMDADSRHMPLWSMAQHLSFQRADFRTRNIVHPNPIADYGEDGHQSAGQNRLNAQRRFA